MFKADISVKRIVVRINTMELFGLLQLDILLDSARSVFHFIMRNLNELFTRYSGQVQRRPRRSDLDVREPKAREPERVQRVLVARGMRGLGVLSVRKGEEMKCIECNVKAVYNFRGNSYCKKHFEERVKGEEVVR